MTTRATAQAGVNLGGALMVYVPTGPQLNERMYAKREENPPGKRPICCLKGWIEASAPLHIGAGIKGLTFGREKLLSDETELACAQNVVPGVTIQCGKGEQFTRRRPSSLRSWSHTRTT